METHGHRSIEHTADLAFEIWAPTQEALLGEAAKTVIEAMTAGASVEGVAERHLALSALDAEDRLVRWMNEILWLAIGEGFLMRDAQVVLSDSDLRATLVGEEHAGHRIRFELKSVTYHDLELVVGSDQCRARVVIDV